MVFKLGDRIIGLFVLHVDDFILGVDESCAEGRSLLPAIQKEVVLGKVTDCMKVVGVFCGREFRQLKDYSVEVSMVEYAKTLEPFRVPRHRARVPTEDLNSVEHRGFRKVMGQLQWAVRMMFFEEAFQTSVLASSYAKPKVKDLIEANAALRRI